MAMLEGGDFHCYIHDFKTASIDEWNAHETSSEHFEEGTTVCTICGTRIQYNNLPFHPVKEDGTKGISLQCPDCSEKTQGSATIKRIEEEE